MEPLGLTEIINAITRFVGVGWVSIIWIALISVCLTLSAVHGLVWLRQRREVASAMFALLSLVTAILGAFDLAMMRVQSPAAYAGLLRWFHAPVWVAFAATIGFLHFYLKTGRPWLGVFALLMRSVSLVINFLSPVNLNYREITSMKFAPFFGDMVSVPVGVTNPAIAVGQLSLLVLLLYAIDASVTCWKRGRARPALAVGGTMILFIGLASAQSALVFYGVIQIPVTSSLFFVGIITVMAHELSRDVLRAVQLNSDLVRERAITEAIFGGIPGMIYLCSPDGRLLRWNQRVEEESGYTRDELKSRKATDWLEPEDRAGVVREWKNAMENRIGRIELNLKFKNGRKVPYLLTGIRVDIDGQPHLVGMGLDMSRQKQMEEELMHQKRELAHMNRVASLGVLVASIAHEINQPLAVVKSNTEAAKRYLATDAPDLGELREILADIDHANVRASGVVGGLRALMRKEPPDLAPLDLNEVIESVVVLIRGECKMRGIEIQRTLAASLPLLPGDRVPLQQVVLNLLLNAVDALADPPITPGQISIHTELTPASRIRMVVRDNGPGIPAELREAVFQPFFTQKKNGMGMGLPICRSIVELHGGTIRAVRPTEGVGAQMEIELPLKNA